MVESAPSFQEVEDALGAVSAHVGAAECQGLLCGMLSASSATEASRWIARVLEDTEPKGETARRCLEVLAGTWEHTRAGLHGHEMDLRLLLPADEAPLPERAAALGLWCQGFLYGLGHDPEGRAGDLPGEAGEAVRSLAEIARIDAEAEGEADEAAYEELQEFVRVAAMLVHEQMQPSRRDKPVPVQLPPQGGLH